MNVFSISSINCLNTTDNSRSNQPNGWKSLAIVLEVDQFLQGSSVQVKNTTTLIFLLFRIIRIYFFIIINIWYFSINSNHNLSETFHNYFFVLHYFKINKLNSFQYLSPLTGWLNIMEPPIQQEIELGIQWNEQVDFRSIFGEVKSEQECMFKNRGYNA